MAKKKAPQRLAGAEESCISPEQEAIIQWFRTVKFRKNLLGGVDEAAMWKKLEELYALYEAAIRAERTRYNVLLEQQTGSLPLDTAKVDSFAKGSPTRGAGERSETERFNLLYLRNQRRVNLFQIQLEQFRHAVLLHGHTVQDIGGLHGAAAVGDDDELGLVAHPAQILCKAADIGIIQGGFDFVQDTEPPPSSGMNTS